MIKVLQKVQNTFFHSWSHDSHVQRHVRISLVDLQLDAQNSYLFTYNIFISTLRTGSFKMFKGPFPGFLTILTL